MKDRFNIKQKQRELYTKLIEQYPEKGNDFVSVLHIKNTKMIVDILDEALVHNIGIRKCIAEFRKEYFADGCINYDRTVIAAENILTSIDYHGITDEEILRLPLMLLENLEIAKECRVLNFV